MERHLYFIVYTLFKRLTYVVVLIGMLGCGSEDTSPDVDLLDEEVLEPSTQAALYTANCAECHGENFLSFVERDWSYGSTEKDLFNSIKVGYEDNGMPGFGEQLTDAEILALSRYILESIDGVTRAELLGDTLDPSTQAAFYTNNCGGCHGQNFLSFVERNWVYGNTESEIFNSIKHGYEENGMPAYADLLTDAEILALTRYILESTEGVTRADLLGDSPEFSEIIESNDLNFRVETMAELDGRPWGMTQLPNAEILITKRGGTLYHLSLDKELTEITGIPTVHTGGQGGLLDVELHPDFNNNQWVYLSYSKTDPDNGSNRTTAVARGRLVGHTLTDVEDIFIALPYENSGQHFGSRLQFDNAGYLYITVGDRGARDLYPQSLSSGIGKVHRILDDGSIPDDNPFVGTEGAVASVFSYGHRNPQGLTLHPSTGRIWAGEHGPQGGDEINLISTGDNYGWPVITYGINYNGTPITDQTEMEGMEQPIHYWVPSIAPCGMDFVSGSQYPAWTGDLMVSSLKFEYLHRLIMEGNQVIGYEELLSGIGRVRDVEMGTDGFLYLTVEGPGRVLRLLPE